jgi:steroid delta-isomerase-like uncharacterized protein
MFKVRKITRFLILFIVTTTSLLTNTKCWRQKVVNSERLKDIVRQEIEEVWNKENFTIADEIISLDYIRHEATEDIIALENYKQFVARFHNAFPDANFKIDDMICEGIKVTVRYTFSGTHKGEYCGIPSTGNKVKATGISISHIYKGKIKETWNYLDKLSILVQLGWWIPPKHWILAYTWGELEKLKESTSIDLEKNKTITRRGLEELWNKGDISLVDDIYDTNFVNHEVTHRQYKDLESYKQYVTAIHSVMSDFCVNIEDIVAEGDEVAARWIVSGTERETGNYYSWGGITIFRLSGGKIVEAWWSRDALGITQQMGIAPKLE